MAEYFITKLKLRSEMILINKIIRKYFFEFPFIISFLLKLLSFLIVFSIVSTNAVLAAGVVCPDSRARLLPQEKEEISNPDAPKDNAMDRWAMVHIGSRHSCAIHNDGTLWCWGAGHRGQLGLGQQATAKFNGWEAHRPVQVGTDSNWAQVSAGNDHTCARRTDGTLWCWGQGTSGQLGNGNETDQLGPVQVGSLTTWTEVSERDVHTCTHDDKGKLHCWGAGNTGQVGSSGGTTQQSGDWAQVSAGNNHTCARRTDGTLWCWGSGSGVGDGTKNSKHVNPVQVGSDSNWAQVSAGAHHTCALRANGTLWCWGEAFKGQLGNGDSIDYGVLQAELSPIQVGTDNNWAQVSAGNDHTCARRTDGTLWCWGHGNSGKLGTGSSINYLTPIQVGSDSNWAQVSAGSDHTCALRADSTLWCWGQGNWFGEDTDQSSPIQIGSLTTWAEVSAGQAHTCARSTNGTLWCFGWSTSIRLGNGEVIEYEYNIETEASVGGAWVLVSIGADTRICVRPTAVTLYDPS